MEKQLTANAEAFLIGQYKKMVKAAEKGTSCRFTADQIKRIVTFDPHFNSVIEEAKPDVCCNTNKTGPCCKAA